MSLLFASCGAPSESSGSFCGSQSFVSSGSFPTTDPGSVSEDVHAHSYKETVTKNYTCTEPGETTFACVCGDSYTESLSARHVFVLYQKTPPVNCLHTGKIVRKCMSCDEILETEGERGEHKLKYTCLEEYATCTVCKEKFPAKRVHSYRSATCLTDGYCLVCGEPGQKAFGHKYGDATCQSPPACMYCEHKSGVTVGHSLLEASCESPARCRWCSYTEGDPLGHTTHVGICGRCGRIFYLIQSCTFVVDQSAFSIPSEPDHIVSIHSVSEGVPYSDDTVWFSVRAQYILGFESAAHREIEIIYSIVDPTGNTVARRSYNLYHTAGSRVEDIHCGYFYVTEDVLTVGGQYTIRFLEARISEY